MKLNYAILRVEPIKTIPDLAGIGSHNKREKKAYQSNPNIKLELTKNNIELVPLNVKYVKGFDELTKEYKKEHDERMKTERTDRKKRYHEMLNSSKNVVADELVMTASHNFFKDMSREQIKEWADTCMDFVYNDLGYKKEQILHATVHLDELTPHIHCVVVPLVKKYDKRTNTERYTISKKQYIKDKIHLSKLQDMYHKRLTDAGYDLERGIKGSDNEHIKIKEYKKLTKKLNQELNVRNDRIDEYLNDFEEKMKTTKQMLIIDKDFVKVKKDTFNSMNNVISESKKVMEIQPKIQTIFNEVDSYASSYNKLERENQKYKKEVDNLKKKNNELESMIINLKLKIDYLLNQLKQILRDILHIGCDKSKDKVEHKVKSYYDNDTISDVDIIDIASNTDKEQVLFDYADISSYMRNDDEIEDVFVR